MTDYMYAGQQYFGDVESGFICPKCGRDAQHMRVPLTVLVQDGHSTYYAPFSDNRTHELLANVLAPPTHSSGTQWIATVCMGCRQGSVWRDGELVYPRPAAEVTPHPDLPDLARDLFLEATGVLPISRRAAAALARASLEALLKERKPDSKAKDLNERVGEIKHEIREPLWKVLTTLRVVGNDALHDGVIAVHVDGSDAGTVTPLLQAINMLVEELVTQPRKANELYIQLSEGKRAGAERAANKFKPAEGPAEGMSI